MPLQIFSLLELPIDIYRVGNANRPYTRNCPLRCRLCSTPTLDPAFPIPQLDTTLKDDDTVPSINPASYDFPCRLPNCISFNSAIQIFRTGRQFTLISCSTIVFE